MKLYELIDYIDPNSDMTLRLMDNGDSESLGYIRTLHPRDYEVYREYNVNNISEGTVHIIAPNKE